MTTHVPMQKTRSGEAKTGEDLFLTVSTAIPSLLPCLSPQCGLLWQVFVEIELGLAALEVGEVSLLKTRACSDTANYSEEVC